ncbi:TonB family protein [Hymenobacter bucti]|uniref:TonB family protein n=1 Tax=Hymenobacter bucti TaxID=1844114 RepID=A0ABW4QPP4_9BACT
MKYLVGSLLCAGLGVGEAAAQQVVPPLKKEFLDSTWHVLPSATGARYRRETEWRDSTAGTIRDYFLSNDQLQSREEFGHIRKRTYHGISEYFDKSGHLLAHAEYANSQRAGELRRYYPSGQLKRRERYAADKRSSGECFAADGKPVPFFEFEVMPRYPEGDGSPQAIVAAIARNFRYPKDARRQRVEGRVLVSFNVLKDGTVADVEVKKPFFPSIDAEAIQAVYKLKRFAPGTQDGDPVKVSFTAPISLKLQ